MLSFEWPEIICFFFEKLICFDYVFQELITSYHYLWKLTLNAHVKWDRILFSVTTVSRSTSILSFTKRSLRIIILQTAMLIPYNAVIIWQLDEKIIFIFAITATKTKCQCSIVYLVFIKRLPTSFWCIRLFTKNFA